MYLTPLQCFALSGFDADSLDLGGEDVPQRELYRMAGNTMAVTVLEIILSTALSQIGS